jgi:hypothetical protein
VRIELTHKGFADLSLTTWVPRPKKQWRVTTDRLRAPRTVPLVPSGRSSLAMCVKINGAGNGIRTRDFDLGKVALYH